MKNQKKEKSSKKKSAIAAWKSLKDPRRDILGFRLRSDNSGSTVLTLACEFTWTFQLVLHNFQGIIFKS